MYWMDSEMCEMLQEAEREKARIEEDKRKEQVSILQIVLTL